MGSSGSDHKNGSVSATLLFCQIQGYWSVKSGGNFSHYFRTEYAHFLNQLETVYNVSKMAVDEIIKEVTSLSNSIHTFLMSKFATKLGKISHNRTQGRIQDSGGRGATAGQTPPPVPGLIHFYVPEHDIMHFTDSPWFLIIFAFRRFYGRVGGARRAVIFLIGPRADK